MLGLGEIKRDALYQAPLPFYLRPEAAESIYARHLFAARERFDQRGIE